MPMQVSLNSHFTFKNIFKQVFLPICMMVFISIYGIVDGLFVSNFDGKEAFAGLNLIYPMIMIVGGLGFMCGSGGSALTGKLLGEGKRETANKVFSMVVLFTFLMGIVTSIGGFFLVKPVVEAMARITPDTTQVMVDKAVLYGRILMLGQSGFMIQNLFQNFFVVDEKQNLGFLFTLAAGVTNIIFDALFVAVFRFGIAGAAAATILGYIAGSIGPIIYFSTNRKGLIYFVKTGIKLTPIVKSVTNGFSDFIFSISSSIVGIVFNIILLKYFGENGVSAYGITMYLSFIFLAVFIGYSIGIAPVISYNYGAKNTAELKNVVYKSILLISIVSFAEVIFSLLLARPLSILFVGYEAELVTLSSKSMMIYGLSFLFSGISIFMTTLFTALNDGLVSGLISIFRTLIFQILAVALLPIIVGKEGVWWAPLLAETLSIIVAMIFFVTNKKKYRY